MLTTADIEAIAVRCRQLPAAQGNYLVDDYVTNLILTVLDFQLHTTIVKRAHDHYQAHRRAAIRTHADLTGLFGRYANDNEGNTALAQFLWGYKYAKRISFLRQLVQYFEDRGVTDQAGLQAWAANSDFERDFKGRIPGLAFAVYKWLVMRQGVETVKPDLHVRNFVEGIVRRSLSDADLVAALEQVARLLGIKAYELDWRIWESERGGPA
jgi:hypothetical protein